MGDTRGFLKVERKNAQYRPVCERLKDFCPVYSPCETQHSQEQASRCMDCGTPFCHWGCPLGNYIPEWNDLMFRGEWLQAFQLLEATHNFPEVTGRICPAHCEYSCVLGINGDAVTIRENELAIIEYAFKNGMVKPQHIKRRTGKRLAIVGSGPAGLACADQLNSAGHKVVVFEKDDKIGGILRYGIPDFKLEKWILDRRLEILQKEGIEFKVNTNVGADLSAQKLYIRGQKTVPFRVRMNNGRSVFRFGKPRASARGASFAGLICFSPAFKNRMKFSLTEKIKIYLGMVLYPRKQFKMPFDSQMCTRDPDCQKAMDADKREHRLATPRLLFNILLAQSRVNSLKEKIKIPVLFLIAGDSDKLTDPGESKAVFNGLKTKDKEIIQYTDMFHSLTIELGREKVFGDILTWVNKRI
jgi:hypothetical protein